MALVHHWKAQIEDVYIRLSGSWLAAGFVILLAYAAAALLLDDYPILPDGLRSMATAGYFDPAPDFRLVFQRLAGVSQQHVPGYFLTLFAWANITGWDPLVLRLLSVWSGVFSLALIYRLARDFVGREAGFIAVVMLASLAFYNYWYLPIRMYTMFVAAELLLLWIYFRIVWRQRTSLGAYIALGLSCLFFLSTQVFSLAICCGLAVYHLIYPRKTRHWLYVALAGTIALLVLLPWIGTLMTGAVEIVEGEFGEIDVLNPLQLIETVFSLGLNGSILFVALLALSLRKAFARDHIAIALWVILAAATAFTIVVNQLTDAIDLHRARYLVTLFPLVILLVVKGMMSLARWKLVSIAVLLFWIASGLLFQRRVGADFYVRSYGTIPIHLVERQLREELRAGDLITGWTDGLNFDYRTPYGGVIDVYFADHDVEFAFRHNYVLGQKDAEEIAAALTVELDGHKRVWLTFELDNASRYRDLFENVLERQYERCSSDTGIRNVIIELYQLDGCS